MQTPINAIRVLPREFAVRHRFDFRWRAPKMLSCSPSTAPYRTQTLREISFELGSDPVQRVVCSVRVEAGLARHYDIEMTARLRHLNSRPRGRGTPARFPYVAPFEGVGKTQLASAEEGDLRLVSAHGLLDSGASCHR